MLQEALEKNECLTAKELQQLSNEILSALPNNASLQKCLQSQVRRSFLIKQSIAF